MPQLIKIVCLIFLSVFAAGALAVAEITPALKVEIFRACRQGCMQYPQVLPDHRSFSETQFLFDSYCRCFCARQAMRLTSDDLEVAEGLHVEGKSLESSKRLGELMKFNANVCVRALME